jgi:recombination DNA repair RAD52 pathway protein
MTHTPSLAAPVFDPDRIFPLTDAQLWALMQGLSEDRVYVLSGNSYVKAWDVKATLIRVFGFGGFSTQIISEGEVFRLEVPRSSGTGKNWSVGYRVSLRLIIPQLGAFFDEAAVGSNSQGSIAEAYDNAVKGATSDALKRCATLLGTQFGLSLYDNGNQNEVIKTIVAPGQEWDKNAKVDVEARRAARQQQQQGQLQQQERPADAASSVAHLRPPTVDDAEHAQNMEHLNSALSAQVKKKAQREGPDVPLYADESLDNGDREEAMAAADGHH